MKVIVTGASKGIGRGIATLLAMDGFELGLLARSADLLDDLRLGIEEQGGTACSVACDLRSADDTNHAIGHLIAELGGLDALVNNAGVIIRKDIFELSLEEWNQLVETNLNGLFHATRAVLPHFREQGHGHLINLSSISGKVPLPGGSAYAATKFAVNGFSQSLLQEVRQYGIKVTTLFPGSVDTESHRQKEDSEESWKVTPEEIGRVCRDVLRTAPGTVISEVEVRPLRPPSRK